MAYQVAAECGIGSLPANLNLSGPLLNVAAATASRTGGAPDSAKVRGAKQRQPVDPRARVGTETNGKLIFWAAEFEGAAARPTVSVMVAPTPLGALNRLSVATKIINLRRMLASSQEVLTRSLWAPRSNSHDEGAMDP
jgi:hypothetical protein